MPLPTSTEIFNEIAILGEELANLEKHFDDGELVIEDRLLSYFDKLDPNFKMTGFRIDSDDESITLKHDRKEFTIKPVPAEILEFNVGGYQVLQQWLKIHSHIYTRTNFTSTHLKRLLHLIQSMTQQVNLINKLDKAVKPLLTDLQAP